jgi:RNA polymerase sigma-70 factor, ECF subfamily
LRKDDVPTSECFSDHAADRQLVERMLLKDAAAWQTFVSQHGRVARSRVADVAASFGYGADASAIDDATADVFASLLANDAAALRAFAGRSSLITYVAVIATRCATRNFARKRYTRNTQSTTNVIDNAAESTDSDPALKLLQAEQQVRIRTLLAELPEKQREVVRLFHLEGQSYAAISRTLGIPIGSVGVTLRRAEAKLRAHMEAD